MNASLAEIYCINYYLYNYNIRENFNPIILNLTVINNPYTAVVDYFYKLMTP